LGGKGTRHESVNDQKKMEKEIGSNLRGTLEDSLNRSRGRFLERGGLKWGPVGGRLYTYFNTE